MTHPWLSNILGVWSCSQEITDLALEPPTNIVTDGR